ncbi:helix-turn-helix transcriptional regulator [Peribacillus asahii]|uniref:helix-turn-helix transcriptional regulator n=1 Tax=Peribacillus asahii TaxID=228899 RepID=UPI00207A931B|nr:helix-turn-helix transcriptional regulator [Peribacillus asahii]USK69198.1 helix-turn-helix transcriptional regulator [Peribacillus asahii]
MENIHPLKYISQTFNVPLSQVAEKLGVSKQTINEWVGKRRKSIPEKHIPKLATIFDIDEKWFRKQNLLGSEKLELQRIYIDRNATFVEYEDYFTDDEGIVHEITKCYSPEQELSNHLFYMQSAEELIEEISKLIYIETDAHDKLYQDFFKDVISVTKSQDRKKIKMLRDVLEYLLYNDNEFGFMVQENSHKTEKLTELFNLYK